MALEMLRFETACENASGEWSAHLHNDYDSSAIERPQTFA